MMGEGCNMPTCLSTWWYGLCTTCRSDSQTGLLIHNQTLRAASCLLQAEVAETIAAGNPSVITASEIEASGHQPQV